MLQDITLFIQHYIYIGTYTYKSNINILITILF